MMKRWLFGLMVAGVLMLPRGSLAQTLILPTQIGSATISTTTCPGAGCAVFNVSNVGAVGVEISGTFSGTIVLGASLTGTDCTTFKTLAMTTPGGTGVTSATAAGVWSTSTAGLPLICARFSSYSSGQASVAFSGAAIGTGTGGGAGGGGAVTQGTSPWVVDGSGVTQPISAATLPAAAADGSTYTAGSTVSSQQGCARDDSSPGALAEDKTGLVRCSTRREQYIQIRDAAGNERGANVNASGQMEVAVGNGSTTDTEDASVASGQSSVALTIPFTYYYNGTAWVRSTGDPCTFGTKVSTPFSIASATTTQLLAASSNNYNYICAINIVVAAANNVALVEDNDAACASPSAGMAGGTTAATGWNFAANGGLTLGNGNGTVVKTAATNRYTCLMTSGTAQTSGNIVSVQGP